jgi:hypothetical protein
VIALVLAVVAAVLIDAYRDEIRSQTLQNNLDAVATLDVYDNQGKVIGQGTGFFITPTGLWSPRITYIKGAGDVIGTERIQENPHARTSVATKVSTQSLAIEATSAY